jgi:hypothetical protein
MGAVLLNALAWQKSRHPAPLFSRVGPATHAKELRIAEMSPSAPARPQPAPSTVQPHEKSVEKPPLEAGQPRQTHIATSPVTPHDEISELLQAPPAPKTPPAPRPQPATTEQPRSTPSKAVMAAQRALVKLGFVLNPDGVAGPTTRRAVERYERDHGLPVRGVLTPALTRRLNMETRTMR